jgi:hypothetical protein
MDFGSELLSMELAILEAKYISIVVVILLYNSPDSA